MAYEYEDPKDEIRYNEMEADREIERQEAENKDEPITDEMVDDMKKIVGNPFTYQLEATIAELQNGYEKLVLFPETQDRIKDLMKELEEIINAKHL